MKRKDTNHYFGDYWEASICSCFDPATTAIVVAIIAAAPAPIFASEVHNGEETQKWGHFF